MSNSWFCSHRQLWSLCPFFFTFIPFQGHWKLHGQILGNHLTWLNSVSLCFCFLVCACCIYSAYDALQLLFNFRYRFILCHFYAFFPLCCTPAHERQALQLVLVTQGLVSRLCYVCVCLCACSVRWSVSRSWSWRKRRGACRLRRPDRGEIGSEKGSWQRASSERETGNGASRAPGPPQPFQSSPITRSNITVRCAQMHTCTCVSSTFELLYVSISDSFFFKHLCCVPFNFHLHGMIFSFVLSPAIFHMHTILSSTPSTLPLHVTRDGPCAAALHATALNHGNSVVNMASATATLKQASLT